MIKKITILIIICYFGINNISVFASDESQLLDKKQIESSNEQINKEMMVVLKNLQGLISELKDINLEPLKLRITNPTNWIVVFISVIIPLLGMIITISIVFAQTKVSLHMISEKTQETLQTYKKSMKNQKEISEQNLKAQVNSKNRQGWINALRAYMADFITLLQMMRCHLQDKICKENEFLVAENQYKKHQDKEEESDFRYTREGYYQAKQKLQETHFELSKTLAKIELLLNPSEQDSVDLINTMRESFDLSCDVKKAIDNEKEDIILIITQKAQKILKAEWEKLQNLE